MHNRFGICDPFFLEDSKRKNSLKNYILSSVHVTWNFLNPCTIFILTWVGVGPSSAEPASDRLGYDLVGPGSEPARLCESGSGAGSADVVEPALDRLGYDLVEPAPEPASVMAIGSELSRLHVLTAPAEPGRPLHMGHELDDY